MDISVESTEERFVPEPRESSESVCVCVCACVSEQYLVGCVWYLCQESPAGDEQGEQPTGV